MRDTASLFKNVVQIDKIAESLSKSQHILCDGLSGSSKSFVVEEMFRRKGGRHLVICGDKESAAYFCNDIEGMLGETMTDYSKKQVLFYPTSYKRPYEPERPDNSQILSRTEVLQRLSTSERSTIIVSYPEALSEKVFSRNMLAKNSLKIKKNDNISLDELTEKLFEYDFQNVDFVVEPGQFAIRGGLVDVFSFANDYPYRIEFIGNEVESIRSFDIASQLSIDSLSQITLLPNMQTISSIEQRVGILEYIPNNITVWIDEVQFLSDRIDNEYEKAVAAYEKANGEFDKPWLMFSRSTELMPCLEKRNTIEFAKNSKIGATETITFNTTPQPVFGKNLNMLSNSVDEYLKDGYKILLFSESDKQLDRIQSILNSTRNKDEDNKDFDKVMFSIHNGFCDKDTKTCFFTDHQIFERHHRYRLRDNFSSKQAITLKELYELKPGDFVTHIDHGIGRFDGLETIETNGKPQEAIRLVYNNGDLLYVSIHSLHRIAKYSGKEGIEPKLSTLGSKRWDQLKNKTKSKVKDIARELIKLYAERKQSKGFQFSPDSYLQTELEASFMYEDTPDQLKATIEVKRDMESESPMDRLICGDVGFGKTEIAMRAAFKAVADSKQVAILVPTTVLALQHYHTLKKRFDGFPVTTEYLNRFKTAKQQKDTLEELEKGHIDIIIGTHRLTGKDVKFKDLGLLIIDEEQKFGVAVKEKLKALKTNVDTLTLTATPIPRTLQFSMMGARDLSIINTPPPNRYPVQTELHGFDPDLIRDAIQYELSRNGQVFFIHNRVQNIMDLRDLIATCVPGVRIAVAHGQMESRDLEDIMLGFINGDYDVLLCTTIVESGLDIPNANTIIVNDAHRYGLSDLHQLRGRVGRSNKKAFCYLLTPPLNTITEEAKKRLTAIEEFSDLGGGINIAMRDLDIRGAGNLLGAEQSGFINDIGFETYHKILDEAIRELKENEFSDIFQQEEENGFAYDCTIETDMEIRLPADYINSTTERLNLYNELDHINNEDALSTFTKNIIDRFGPMPQQTNELITTIRLRWIAKQLGIEKITLKNNLLAASFVDNTQSRFYDSDTFHTIITYVMANPKRCIFKESNGKTKLIVKEVCNVNQALRLLNEIKDFR